MTEAEAAALVGRYFVSNDAGDIYQVVSVAPASEMSSGWSMPMMSDRIGAECDNVDAALTTTDYVATSSRSRQGNPVCNS